MTKKVEQLKELMTAGEWSKALSLAAKFPRLGEQKERISIAYAATRNPLFYSQIGKNPATLIDEGIAALRERFGADL